MSHEGYLIYHLNFSILRQDYVPGKRYSENVLKIKYGDHVRYYDMHSFDHVDLNDNQIVKIISEITTHISNFVEHERHQERENDDR